MANLVTSSLRKAAFCLRRLATSAHPQSVYLRHRGLIAVFSRADVCKSHRRHLSQYVQGARRLQKLKEDETFCRESWAQGNFAVFYDLRPLVVPSLSDEGKQLKIMKIAWKHSDELSELLKEDFRADESIVLNCNISDPTSPPKFAINIASKSSEPDHKEKFEKRFGSTTVSGRTSLFVVSKTDARILGQCLPHLQWHIRHQFCSNCGERTTKDPSGSKRTCPTCSTVHYPILSPVAIVLVTNGDRCLVVRQPRFMAGMYSAISGFLEPGESLEAAVRREVAEEVGLEVEEVKFFSSQSWAFPLSSLMLGCHASIKPGTTDHVSLDEAELEDSRWLHREEVLTILDKSSPKDDDIWLPPEIAIAHRLLKSWALKEN